METLQWKRISIVQISRRVYQEQTSGIAGDICHVDLIHALYAESDYRYPAPDRSKKPEDLSGSGTLAGRPLRVEDILDGQPEDIGNLEGQ